jgi:hypothetical protein
VYSCISHQYVWEFDKAEWTGGGSFLNVIRVHENLVFGRHEIDI